MIKYWLLVVTAACLGVAVAFLPPPEPTATKSQTRIVRADSSYLVRQEDPAVWFAYSEYVDAATRLRFARLYARILERADSLLLELGDYVTPDGDVLLTFGPGVPLDVRQVVRARLNYVSGDLVRPITWPYPAAVAVVVDTVGDAVSDRTIRFRMPPYVYLLPDQSGRPCISLVTIGRTAMSAFADNRLGPRRILGSSPLDLLGPCAFYSQFGLPGSAIEDWVQAGHHATVSRPNWLAPRRLYDPVFRRMPWSGHAQYPTLTACASGDRTACLTASTTASSDWTGAVFHSGRPEQVAIGWRDYWFRSTALGPGSGSFLSDMVVALGEERFGRFWNSNQSVSNGFLVATGTSLEDWTMEWARGQIGIPRRGPSLPAGSVILSLLLCVVFVGAGAAFAGKRAVG